MLAISNGSNAGDARSLRVAALPRMLALCLMICTVASADEVLQTSATQRSVVDLAHRPVPRLEPGIVIGQQQAAGYSNLVTLVLPRLSAGHIDSLPEFAKDYASMFKFTVLANVTAQPSGDKTEYLLQRIGIGFAVDIKGRDVVVTQDTANKYGARMGIIDRGVLGGNEDCLQDIVQIARTDRLIIFDAVANMLVGDAHEERIIRHFLWASPASGEIGFLVWMLNENGSNDYDIASPTMQMLPPGFREDRQIHVSEGGFLSSIPTADRFALVSLPQGKPVPFTAKMKNVAGRKAMTRADLKQFVEAVSESIALASANQGRSYK